MDIFGDDIDTLLQNGDDEINENIANEENVENEDSENKDEKNRDSGANVVEPKKRVVRNPQLRLNVERLKSDRGIHTVEKYCADLKFRGKGHERDDLNILMKRLEHWAHRLYPSYKFGDFIATVEKLGKKKQMQTHMYRYRHDLLLLNDVAKQDLDGGNEANAEELENLGTNPIDELDEIIEKQIQNYTSITQNTPVRETTFDSILSSMANPRLRKESPINSLNQVATNNSIDRASTLSLEQMAKIAENRRLAQERLSKKKAETKILQLDSTTN